MKKSFLLLAVLCSTFTLVAQEQEEKEKGHTNDNKFRQLYQEFSTPNQYRTASGAPGHAYTKTLPIM